MLLIRSLNFSGFLCERLTTRAASEAFAWLCHISWTESRGAPGQWEAEGSSLQPVKLRRVATKAVRRERCWMGTERENHSTSHDLGLEGWRDGMKDEWTDGDFINLYVGLRVGACSLMSDLRLI